MTLPAPRLLLISHGLPPARVGGAELVTWRLASGWVGRGRAAAVLTRDDAPEAQPGVLQRQDRGGVAVYALGATPDVETSPDARNALARVLALWRPDVVWVHHLSGLDLALAADTLEAGLPLLVTLHDYWWMCPRGQLVRPDGGRCPGPAPERCAPCTAPGAPLPLRWLSRWGATAHGGQRRRRARTALLGAAGVSAPSHHVARRYEAWLGRRNLVDVVPNPAPMLRRVPPPPARGPLRVGYFGSLIPTKGIEPLLQAAAVLPAGAIDLTLHGGLPDGAPWAAWRLRVRELVANAPARLAGPYAPAEAAERLASVELVVAPSLWEENAPLVLAEAWAVGRPVLASSLGGLPEALADPVRGRCIPPGEVDAWATALADRRAWRETLQSISALPPPQTDPGDEALRWAIQSAGR